ncbi:MAG TPA: hypothetical protein VFA93_02590 [Patescibacteria group bacterium]|nr:hypothetical protein [Patescibacteria group bacterium]
MINPENERVTRKEKDPRITRFHPEGYSYAGSTPDNHPVFESKGKIVPKLFSAMEEVDEIEIVNGNPTKAIHRTRIRPLPREKSRANSHVGKLLKKISRG